MCIYKICYSSNYWHRIIIFSWFALAPKITKQVTLSEKCSKTVTQLDPNDLLQLKGKIKKLSDITLIEPFYSNYTFNSQL